MKQFIFKIAVFGFLMALAFTWISSKADGSTDPFYLRFTTPKKENLILGTSRAAQGILPQVLDSVLQKPFFNYSFTIMHSPYGPTYLHSIQKKIQSNVTNGIYVLSVDPWSISNINEEDDSLASFRELKFSLKNTPSVNLDPNPIYLANNYEEMYLTILSQKSSGFLLHDNGWLEINYKMDSLKNKKNIDKKVNIYREKHLPQARISKDRLEYLLKLIHFLKSKGEVYLVRLPIHDEMMRIENQYISNFDSIIRKAINISDGYLDFTQRNSDFQYTDGNHLYKDSGKLVSTKIANWIKARQEDKTILDKEPL